jgi:hypothetical protein
VTNNPDSSRPSGDTDQHSGPELKLSATAPKQQKVGTDSKNGTKEQPTTAQEMRREFRWFEFGQLAVNGALVIVGIFALYIYHGQLTTMNGQLSEMQEARKQAKIDNANAIIAQQGIAQSALTKSQTNFEQSMKETQRSFREDQRAWIGAVNQVVGTFDSRTFDAQLEFTNSGKTPARRVQRAMSIMTSPLPLLDGPSQNEIRDLAFYGSQTLAPQAHTTLRTESADPLFGQIVTAVLAGHYDAVNKGTEILYIYGEWKYVDVDNRPHTTTWCNYLLKTHQNPPRWGLASCNKFDEMD